jgi:DNA-binding HxlR family transcriptional regulator
MLAQQLRELERDGLIERTVYPEVPPRVEYQITPFGETLRPVIDTMWTWGKQTREAQEQKEPSMTETQAC